MSEATLVMLLFAGMGVLLWALGRGMRNVRPNPWYGVRVAATFADERVWYDANRRGGVILRRLGIGLAAFALGAWALLPWPWPAVVPIVASTAGTAWLLFDSITYANRRLAHYRALDAAHGDQE